MPGMNPPPAVKISFKAQMREAREEAIIRSVGRLLAEKGFDAMTVDEVAADVGIAKASLYKHFPSKEELACAAMLRVMRRAQDFLRTLPPEADPLDKLRAVARWALDLQLAGEMPVLPGRHSSLRAALMASREGMEGLAALRAVLAGWIATAQAQGSLNPGLPAPVVLYTLCARACDPLPAFLQADGQYSDAQIVELVMRACFDGLDAR